MTIDSVDEVVLGAVDAAGAAVSTIYAKNRRLYAVYGTDQRVTIQFADDPAIEAAQRSKIAPLSPIRGEINGLIDGWRDSKDERKKAKGKYFDRRVADALVLGLEDDVPGAATALQSVKQDLKDERVSIGRFRYLIVASGTCAILIALIVIYTSDWYGNLVGAFRTDTWPILLGSAAGAVGAFFSIAIGIRNRTVLTDLNTRDNTEDALLRILIGVIGAALLMCLLKSQMIDLSIGGAAISPDVKGVISWPITVVAGFVAGFSERLIPDLLARAAVNAAGQKAAAATQPSVVLPIPVAPTPVAATGGSKANGLSPGSTGTSPLPQPAV